MALQYIYLLNDQLADIIVRGGILNAGDYDYEPNDVLHRETEALEDTEYLFICDGPILFCNKDGLTNYLGWEELARMKEVATRNDKKEIDISARQTLLIGSTKSGQEGVSPLKKTA